MQPTDDVQSLINEVVASISDDDIRMDVESVLAKMSNKTYVEASDGADRLPCDHRTR